MSKKICFIASNYGLWAEELQAPWDAIKKAGHDVTLATYMGKTPLPIGISVDTGLIDPVQNYLVNPPEVVERTRELLAAGEWDNPIKTEDINVDEFDGIIVVGGPGAPLDITGNPKVHKLLQKANAGNKLIGALCYAVGALVLTRKPEDNTKSIIEGRTVTAHPAAWDFTTPLAYDLDGATEDNKGTDVVTPGFVYPLEPVTRDAVGPKGTVLSDPTTNRDKPQVAYDFPFVTALSVESSIAFGDKLVEALAEMK